MPGAVVKIKSCIIAFTVVLFAFSSSAQEDRPISNNPYGTNTFQKRTRVYQKKNKVTQKKNPSYSKTPPKAEVRLKTEIPEPEYKIVSPREMKCGTAAAGCTSYEAGYKINFEYTSENMIKAVNLTVSLKNEIRISSEYPKGSCFFDHILKHELTHAALNKKIFQAYAAEIPKAVLAKLDTLSQPLNPDGYREVYASVNTLMKDMRDEQRKENKLLDGDENYTYQWRQVAELCAHNDGNEKLRGMFMEQMERHRISN